MPIILFIYLLIYLFKERRRTQWTLVCDHWCVPCVLLLCSIPCIVEPTGWIIGQFYLFIYLFSAYTVRIHQKTNLQLSEYYNATITKWPWKSPGDYKTSYNKLIPIDKYSPKVKRIRKKVFIVLSNYDQSQNLDFYLDRSLGTEDEVFKDGRTTHKFNKRFNRLWRKCRKKISRSKSWM